MEDPFVTDFSAIRIKGNSMLQYSKQALPLSLPPSATGTNRHILLGFIVVDGGVAAASNPQGRVPHTAKVILSFCMSRLGSDPSLLDVLVNAFAGTETTSQSSSPQSRGETPYFNTATPDLTSAFVYAKLSRQARPRSASLSPESLSIADDLARQHDWSDLNLQCDLAVNVRDYMAPRQCDLLATALEKVRAPVGSSFTNYWVRQAAWHRYDSLASVVACSTYSRSEDLIHCGDGRFSCQDRLLCPRCCYNFMVRRVGEELGGSFTADTGVYYIVMSLSRDPDETHRLQVNDIGEDVFHGLKHRAGEQPHIIVPGGACEYGVGFDGYDDLLQCRILWHFFMEAIREFTGNRRGRLFSGVAGGPELAVQLDQLRVLPHANYICWSSGISIDGLRELRRYVRTKMLDCRKIESGLYPSVACYRLRTADDLRRVINYIFKPIDLASAYGRAADLAGYVPAAMREINREVNLFLKNALDVFWGLRRVARYGRCHASHQDYIGEVSVYRLAQRESAAERRADGGRGKHRGSKIHPVDRWQMHYEDQFERPIWPRQSRFERRKAQFDQSQPPISVRARRKVQS